LRAASQVGVPGLVRLIKYRWGWPYICDVPWENGTSGHFWHCWDYGGFEHIKARTL